jgi:hypothetical protein
MGSPTAAVVSLSRLDSPLIVDERCVNGAIEPDTSV